MGQTGGVMESGAERFTVDDLGSLASIVGSAWSTAADLDWSVPAGTLEWSCLHTADHAVDCVFAPACFLASRRTDRYPAIAELLLGDAATPAALVESLDVATRMLAAVVRDAEPDVRVVMFGGSPPTLGAPYDMAPRAAMELALHAHDVCCGLGVPFEPPADLCHRLREHTRPWPLWRRLWDSLDATADPWGDLLRASGRQRSA